MHLLLISASMMIASWIAIIFGLYFAIKFKEAGKVGKSKFFYFVIMAGEVLSDVSWYMFIISIALMIAKMFV